MSKVRLYLDVDGVVNAWYADKAWGEALSLGDATSDTGTYSIRWAPAMIKALNDLDLEVVWTTTWRELAAPMIGDLVGLHSSRHIDPISGRTTFPSIRWKHESVLKDQEDNPGPFIWIDDEMRFVDVEAARKLGGLAIGTDGWSGITPAHIETIKHYLEGVTANADTTL